MRENRPILLVEDSAYDRDLAITALQRCRVKNKVVSACDGEEALDYVFRRGKFVVQSEREPIVVLLDIKLPRVSGIDVLAEIKGHPSYREVPVVMFTASNEPQDLKRTYELGCNGYVVKPMNYGEYVEAFAQMSQFWAIRNEVPYLSGAAR